MIDINKCKEERPVDDPEALRAYGWLPGGYICGACSDCKEPFMGAKRSWRCQDCAEALSLEAEQEAEELVPQLLDIPLNQAQWVAANATMTSSNTTVAGQMIINGSVSAIHNPLQASQYVIAGAGTNTPAMTISNDGKITFDPNLTADEAARAVIDTLQKMTDKPIDERPRVVELLDANTRYLTRARASEALLFKLYETHTMRTKPDQTLLDSIGEHLKAPWA